MDLAEATKLFLELEHVQDNRNEVIDDIWYLIGYIEASGGSTGQNWLIAIPFKDLSSPRQLFYEMGRADALG